VQCGKSEQPHIFIMYQGSSTELGNGDVATFGASVVLHLTQRLSTPGHQIFMGNYLTTCQILELLKTKGMNAAGTIRGNSGFTSHLFSLTL
jgi:hypothetical protein